MSARLRLRWLRPRRPWPLVAAAFTAALLTLITNRLPQFDVIEAAMNDENFTDLVLKTRGELPIDTAIRVVTFDRSIFDREDRIDRSALALRLAALFDLAPRVVAVDVLLEDERPEAPDGDEMLAGLIADHRNLIFGIFHEDSLDRFRVPPSRFGLDDSQLGCINLTEDDDRTIRTYSLRWGSPERKQYESFDLRVARLVDSAAAAKVAGFSRNTFIIDYAGGIGEESDVETPNDVRIFPTMPLETIYTAVMSGDSLARAALRKEFADKAVLVGYADIRNSQVTSIVDRFYTPLKPEDNAIPDMHGVAIHANVLNTIVQRRIVETVPAWLNVLWATALVIMFLLWWEGADRNAAERWKKVLQYGGFGLFLLVAVMIPVIAFRYTPYKFSIYSPFTGLLLSLPTMEVYVKGSDFVRNLLRRRRTKRLGSSWLRENLFDVFSAGNGEARYLGLVHFLQLQFHTACAIVFDRSTNGGWDHPSQRTIARPTPQGMLRDLAVGGDTISPADPASWKAIGLLRLLGSDPRIVDELRLSTSLYIALTEIRRQSDALEEEASEKGGGVEARTVDATSRYIDLTIAALTGDEEEGDRFGELFDLVERYAAKADGLLRNADGSHWDPSADPQAFFPYLLKRKCRLHGTEEIFVYVHEQEDANDRDDFHDLLYVGRTIRCQPVEHPGLTAVRAHRLRERPEEPEELANGGQ